MDGITSTFHKVAPSLHSNALMESQTSLECMTLDDSMIMIENNLELLSA
jgi:hypothetical protein